MDFGSGEMRYEKTTLCFSSPMAHEVFTVKLAQYLEVLANHEAVAYLGPLCPSRKYVRPGLYTGIINASYSFTSNAGLVVGMTLVKSAPASMPVLVVEYPVWVVRGSVVGNFGPMDCVSGSHLDPC